MARKLELIREEKLYRLVPGRKRSSRLEASGVALVDDRTALVVFDNMNLVARVDIALKHRRTNRFLPAPSLGVGFEDVAIDRDGGRIFCLIEALEDVDGRFRGFVAEYDAACRFIRCDRLTTVFKSGNKGFEGITHLRRRGREYLFALCEGNLGSRARQRGARIDVFTRASDRSWKPSHRIGLPKKAAFEDYAAISYRDGCLAVVSQKSARLFVARVDEHARRLVPGSEAVYRFPKKSYGNVEGIAWLSEDVLVAVSDRKKARQPGRSAAKDQSIHVFRIPGDARH
jgi:hypothetical protein